MVCMQHEINLVSHALNILGRGSEIDKDTGVVFFGTPDGGIEEDMTEMRLYSSFDE